PQAEQALLDVPLYFAHQTTPRVSHRREITVNRKTNAFNKTDIEACEWVMLSALKALQESAKKNGYDAVASIKSNYQHNEFASNSEFQCGAGTFIAGAALKADLIRFKN
ncbi:MAG: excinuclease ABC subunit A, partial [Idiomarina sp. 34-48-12]